MRNNMVLKGCNCLDSFNKQDLIKAIKDLITVRNREIDFVRTKAPATPKEKEFVISDIRKEISRLNNLNTDIENTQDCTK
jgi:hypothetical protein